MCQQDGFLATILKFLQLFTTKHLRMLIMFSRGGQQMIMQIQEILMLRIL